MAVRLLPTTLLATATRISTESTFCKQILFQNNSAHIVRVGDSTVSATVGIALAPGTPGGSFNSGPPDIYHTYLSDWYLFGTVGDVIQVLYIT